MAPDDDPDDEPMAMVPASAWGSLAAPGSEGPAPFSYWVVEGRLAAGAHPAVREGRLDSLLRAGVRSFIDLTEPGSFGDDGYESVLAGASPGATVERYPIVDFTTPSVEQAGVILAAIDRLLDERRTVYVHCLGGLGRTGTVVGCWLIRHGLARPDTALATLARLRASIVGGRSRSPETDDQRRFVEAWTR
jgi:hypothetical protein